MGQTNQCECSSSPTKRVSRDCSHGFHSWPSSGRQAVPFQSLCVDLERPEKWEVDQGLEMYGESHDPVSLVRDPNCPGRLRVSIKRGPKSRRGRLGKNSRRCWNGKGHLRSTGRKKSHSC